MRLLPINDIRAALPARAQFLTALLITVLAATPGAVALARQVDAPARQTQDAGAKPSSTPDPTARQAPQAGQELSPRERRALAYAKLLEGQRRLSRARGGLTSARGLGAARRAFLEASALDPTLAEAHTALAEISFQSQEVEQAEAEAAAALRISPDNFGAHRLLTRIHTIKSGLFQNRLDRARADLAISELREVVRLEPKDAEGWALLGELYQATGREREAIEAFTRWTTAPAPADTRFYEFVTQGRELSPTAASASLGEALLRAGRPAEAAEVIRHAVASEPGNPRFLELLSRTVEPGDSKQAQNIIADLRRALAAQPTNGAVVALLARTQARAGLVDDAAATIRGSLVRSQAADPREQLALRSELAQIYADALRFDDALGVYEEMLAERGIKDAPLTSDGDKRFASLVLERVVALRRQAGQWDQALAAIERMRRLLGVADPSADLQYVILLRQQGKRAEALKAVQESRARHPARAEFARLEATVLAELGRVDEAAKLLGARLKGVAEDYEEYLNIANLYMEAGRGREAVEAARKALELAPADQTELVTQALFMLSSAQERAGDSKGSEETLQRILSTEPNNPTALNNLGYFLVERNERLTEALAMIRRAVRAEPTNASFLDSLGWAHFKLGQLDEAERFLGDAARRNPSSATIQEHLGDLFARRGKPEQARVAWRKALSLSIEAAETDRLNSKLNAAPEKK